MALHKFDILLRQGKARLAPAREVLRALIEILDGIDHLQAMLLGPVQKSERIRVNTSMEIQLL